MTNRIIVLGALFLAFALSVNWVLEESEEAAPTPQRNDPDLYMLNASIDQYNAAGQLQHRIQANRFTHFPLTDLTAMKSPQVSFGESAGKTPWSITSADGRLLPASAYREEIVELWNNVLAVKDEGNGRFIQITTNSLTVYPARKYAETNTKVFIDSESGRTSAAGMRAYFEQGRFVFHSSEKDRVTTIFMPQST